MQLQQLKALVCVADCGSISAAARDLRISQPGITRSLKQLERDVGATLLSRGATGVALTPYGAALVSHARQILEQARRAREEVEQLVGERSGSLAVASSAVPIALVVPRAIELLRRAFPKVYVRLQEAVYPTVMGLFRDAAIDFAIGPVPADGLGDDFRCDALFRVQLVVVVKRGHPLSRARSLSDLADLDWIVAGPRGGPGAVHEQAFLAAGLNTPRCAMHCDSVPTALQVIEHSDVASFVPEPLAKLAEAAGLASIVRIRQKPPPLDISMFMPAQTILTPAGRALFSAIRTVSRSLPQP